MIAHGRRLNGVHGTWCTVSMAEAHAAGDWVSEDLRKVTCPDCLAAVDARHGLGPQRPSSITGGARYDAEPVPGQWPVTVRYFVAWRTTDGDTRYVASMTHHRGHNRYVYDDEADRRFRDRVEVDMRKWPPI